MQIHIKTYGCTLNRADSDIVESAALAAGMRLTDEQDADVIVVNTCTVKAVTERKILERLARYEAAGRRVVVTGCMASANSDLIERYAPGASIITTPNAHMIPGLAAGVAGGGRFVIDRYSRRDAALGAGMRSGVIARIPISDGCLSACSFCETKRARGPLNSFPEGSILRAVSNAVANGAREIELASQDTGAYGLDRGTDIARLMERISGIDGEFMVRIGMLNPEHMHRYIDRFISAMADRRFYKFVHLPVQSGSDRVLGAMRRNYTISSVMGMFGRLRAEVEGITLETDVIVGYPGETRSELEETFAFLESARPDITNISKFAPRPHAPASALPQFPNDEVKSRSSEASRRVRAIQHSINEGFIGKSVDVLITEKGAHSANGKTRSYRQVVISEGHESVALGTWQRAIIEKVSADAVYGVLA